MCFRDQDGDGVAEAYGCDNVDAGEITDGSFPFGDCDDGDDNNYPGNTEVCDGLDNDCSGEPSFDAEEHDSNLEAGILPSCAAGADVRLFLRGGGNLAGDPLSGGASALHVAPGAVITGEIKLRAFFPAEDLDDLAAVAVASWLPPEQGFISLWDPLNSELDPPTGSPYNVSIDPSEVELTAPDVTSSGDQIEYITIAASIGTGSPNLAAMSAPNYCCADLECPPPNPDDPGPACEPVWKDLVDLPNDEVVDLDLKDLTELDLGGCRSFGAARINELHRALRSGNEPCEIGPPSGPGEEGLCLPFYRPKEIGCVIIPIVIEDEGEEG